MAANAPRAKIKRTTAFVTSIFIPTAILFPSRLPCSGAPLPREKQRLINFWTSVEDENAKVGYAYDAFLRIISNNRESTFCFF
jgi:hypothetical protein